MGEKIRRTRKGEKGEIYRICAPKHAERAAGGTEAQRPRNVVECLQNIPDPSTVPVVPPNQHSTILRSADHGGVLKESVNAPGHVPHPVGVPVQPVFLQPRPVIAVLPVLVKKMIKQT